MGTIDQIYRENLKQLARELGGPGALAKKLGKSAAQVSQWLNASKDSKTGKPRALAKASAREIEQVLGKPEGWMDRAHGDEAQPAAAEPARGSVFEALTPDEERLLANFRDLVDEDDRRQVLEEVANKAARMRVLRARFMEQLGMSPEPSERHAADMRQTKIARAALEVTDNLRQRTLFEPRTETDK